MVIFTGWYETPYEAFFALAQEMPDCARLDSSSASEAMVASAETKSTSGPNARDRYARTKNANNFTPTQTGA
jgi:hypothetical protein